MTFFLARVCFGNYHNVFFFRDMAQIGAQVGSLPVFWGFVLACSALSVLNLYWFWRIIAVILFGSALKKEEIAGRDRHQ